MMMYRKRIYERYLTSDGFSDFDAIEKQFNSLFNIFDFNKTDVFPVYPIKHGLKSIIRYYGYRFYELIYKLGIMFEMGGQKTLSQHKIYW
jgi:hypothetical protein